MIKETQLKLTAWYLLIIMTITLSVSTFIYTGVSTSTQHALEAQRIRLERRINEGGFYQRRENNEYNMPPLIDEETIIEVRTTTLKLLAVINLVILCITGILAYFFAGITLKPVDEMLKRQKRFISDAAHEVKTPLTIMKSNLEIATRDKKITLTKSKEVLAQTIIEIDQLNGFLNSLLKKSKYQNGSADLEIEIIDLKLLLAELILDMSKIAANKDIHIKSTLEDRKILGNPKLIQELFSNLVDNSIKYSPKNSVITIKMTLIDKRIVVDICDEGIGIAEVDLPHIFEPFYRADKSRSKETHEGFGLGLSIVKEIADKHKAKMQVQSKLNEGTRFTVEFQRA